MRRLVNVLAVRPHLFCSFRRWFLSRRGPKRPRTLGILAKTAIAMAPALGTPQPPSGGTAAHAALLTTTGYDIAVFGNGHAAAPSPSPPATHIPAQSVQPGPGRRQLHARRARISIWEAISAMSARRLFSAVAPSALAPPESTITPKELRLSRMAPFDCRAARPSRPSPAGRWRSLARTLTAITAVMAPG